MFRALAVAAAINLICLSVLAWSTTERLGVRVIVTDGSASAVVGSATVSVPLAATEVGSVGLFLQGADPHAAVIWPTGPEPEGSSPAPTVGDWLYRLGAESSWQNVQVKDLATGRVRSFGEGLSSTEAGWSPLSGEWFIHPLSGLSTARPGLIAATTSETDRFELTANLARPRNAAGVFLGSPDGANGLLLYFRPEDRDVMWYQVVDGAWQGPIASAPYRAFQKDAVSGIQDVARLALGGYPAALVVSLVLLGLGALETRATRRRLAPVRVVQDSADADCPRPWEASRPVPRVAALLARLTPTRLTAITALLIGVIALLSTSYVAAVVLQGMPHVQDSVAYLFQAKTFALGRLSVPVPPDSEFFTHEFVVMSNGQWFSKYPPGWPMLLALGVLINVPWVVNPICGALSLLVVYRLGREVYRPRVGLMAAALGLVSPFFLFLSGSMMSHTSGLLFAVLFVWAFWRANRSRSPLVASALSGCAFGVGFLIRPYTMAVIAIPFAVYALYLIGRNPRDGIARYAPSAVAVVPFVIAFLAYNAHFTGNPFYPPQQLWWDFDRVGFGPGHGPWGFTPIDALNNTSRNLLELLTHTYGWPTFVTLSLAAIPFVTGRVRGWDWLLGAGFLAVVVGYFFWWADGIMYGPRFYFEGLGFVLLLTARGIDEALDLARWGWGGVLGSGRKTPALAAPTLVYGFVAVLVAFNAAYYFPGQWQLYHGYNYVNHSKLDAVEAAGIHDSVVFADVGQWYEWWEYGMVFSANDPLLRGDVIYARDLGLDRDRILMHDFPGRSFYRLEGTRLTRIGSNDSN